MNLQPDGVGEVRAVRQLPFERAIALDPELWAAHLFYGFSCRDTGKFERALSLYEHAAKLNPDDYLSYGMLADVYEALGQHEKSKSAARLSILQIEAALIQRPENADAIGMGAAALVFLRENAKAEEWAKRAILLDPESYGIVTTLPARTRSLANSMQRSKASNTSVPECRGRGSGFWVWLNTTPNLTRSGTGLTFRPF